MIEFIELKKNSSFSILDNTINLVVLVKFFWNWHFTFWGEGIMTQNGENIPKLVL